MAASDLTSNSVKRVVLLAREGKARDKLRLTLAQIGAELVLEADPNTVDTAALQSVHPQALLIALEPAVEGALDRLDAAINDGGHAVIFDDAEVAAQRDGWDAQRWSRHLAAKLHGHDDVLPPGREEDGEAFAAPRATARGFDNAGFDAHAPSFAIAPASDEAQAPKADKQEAAFGFGALSFDDDAAAGLGVSTPASAGNDLDAPLDFDMSGFEASSFGMKGIDAPASLDSSTFDAPAAKREETTFDFGALSFDDDAAAGLGAHAASGHDAKAADEFAGFDFGEIKLDSLAADEPAPHAGLDFSRMDFDAPEEVSLPALEETPAPPAPKADAPAKSFSFGELSLEEIEAPVEDTPKTRLLLGDEPPEDWKPAGQAAAPATPHAARFEEPPPVPAAPAFGRASFGLVEDEPAPPPPPKPVAAKSAAPSVPGAVLLFAGMGGPDAVRRLLADLPKNFRRPVFVHQHLDGGSYTNLVKQLERVATMPVALAEAGASPSAGTIYVVPSDVAVNLQFGMLSFGAGETDFATLIPDLPPGDSAVLLLSGADRALVDPAYALSVNGAFVAGQSAQNCYDPAAAKALADYGCDSGTPNELATRLVALW